MCICFDELFDELAETEFKAEFEQRSMLMKIYLLFTLQSHLVSCRSLAGVRVLSHLLVGDISSHKNRRSEAVPGS